MKLRRFGVRRPAAGTLKLGSFRKNNEPQSLVFARRAQLLRALGTAPIVSSRSLSRFVLKSHFVAQNVI
jgi:hypothetical protein